MDNLIFWTHQLYQRAAKLNLYVEHCSQLPTFHPQRVRQELQAISDLTTKLLETIRK